MKYEVDRSLFNATQRRVDRLVVQNRDKDLTIEDLEMKVKTLERTVKDVTANSAKAGLVRLPSFRYFHHCLHGQVYSLLRVFR